MIIKDLPKRKDLVSLLPQNGIGAEIGVMRGLHAKSLHKSNPKKFHLIDFWSQHPKSEIWQSYKKEIEDVFYGEIKEGSIILNEGKASDILPTFKDNYFDWVYIDANHQYQHVSKDIELSLPKVKKGGIIAGHDFHCAPYGYGTGVMRAVIENIQEGRLKLIALTSELVPDWVCEVL